MKNIDNEIVNYYINKNYRHKMECIRSVYTSDGKKLKTKYYYNNINKFIPLKNLKLRSNKDFFPYIEKLKYEKEKLENHLKNQNNQTKSVKDRSVETENEKIEKLPQNDLSTKNNVDLENPNSTSIDSNTEKLTKEKQSNTLNNDNNKTEIKMLAAESVEKNKTFFAKVKNTIQSIFKQPVVKEVIKQAVENLQTSIINNMVDDTPQPLKPKAANKTYETINQNIKRKEKETNFNNQLKPKKHISNKIASSKNDLSFFYKEVSNNDYLDSNVDSFLKQYFQEVCEVINQGLDLAIDYNNFNQIEIANNIINLSSTLLNATKGTAKFFQLIENNKLKTLSKYTNPIQITKDFGSGFLTLGATLGNTFLKLAMLNHLSITDPKGCIPEAEKIIRSISNKMQEINSQYLQPPYKDKVVLISQTLTEMITDSISINGDTNLISKTNIFLKKIPKLVEKETAIAKTASTLLNGTNNKIKKVLAPIGNAILDTKDIINVANQQGYKTTLEALEFIIKQPQVTLFYESIGNVVEQITDNIEELRKYKKAATDFYISIKAEATYK